VKEAVDTAEVEADQEDMTADTDRVAAEVEADMVSEVAAVAEATVDATTAARRATWPEIAPAPPREGAATSATKLDTFPGIAPPMFRPLVRTLWPLSGSSCFQSSS